MNATTQSQLGLFSKVDNEKSVALMKCMDEINSKQGSDTIKIGACGARGGHSAIDGEEALAWAMRRNHKSPGYVTGWSELLKVD